MTDILEIVRHDLLEPAGLTDNHLETIIYQLSVRKWIMPIYIFNQLIPNLGC